MTRENPEKERVIDLRLKYQFYKPERQADGLIMLDGQHVLNLPRICFAVEFDKYKEKPRVLAKRIFLAARRKALEVIRHAR